MLGFVADLVMQEYGSGVNVNESFTSSKRGGGVTDSIIRKEGNTMIEDKINQIFDEIQKDNRDFEESYQGLAGSATQGSLGLEIGNMTGAFAGINKNA